MAIILTVTAVAPQVVVADEKAAPSKFVPFVVDEGQFNDIRNYLLGIDLPAKWTYPVLARLDQLERDAALKQQAAEAKAIPFDSKKKERQ